MTTISADERFAREQAIRVPSTRRRALRRIRTELIMIGSGSTCVIFASAYAITHV